VLLPLPPIPPNNNSVTKTQVYLDTAINGTRYIIARLSSQLTATADTSLYHGGVAGLGYILDIMANYTGDATYGAAAERVCTYVLSRATKTTTGLKLHKASILRWGSTGIGLYLLDRYQRTRDPALLAAVVSAATEINSEGVPAKEGGIKWFYQGRAGVELPNYADGAAGVGYFFASLYHFTGDRTWLQVIYSTSFASYISCNC
jgi:lantibiotic modifying enzyme